MRPKKCKSMIFQVSLLVIVAVSLISGAFVFNVQASPASDYYYRFTVDNEGFTNVEVNFNSTDAQGASWVFVPKFSTWNYSVTRGQIVQSQVVETDQVTNQKQYFYQAFKFSYQANGIFNMALEFGFDNGALIIEPRGIFYSPQIGFQSDSAGKADVVLYSGFTVSSGKAIVIGATRNYLPYQASSNRVLFNLQENIVRVQVEFSTSSTAPQFTTLTSSDNKTFTFKSVTRYQTYAQNVMKLYDRIYGNYTRLFNATLDNVAVQWFLPDFDALLTVGGFVPFTGEQLGEVNINIVFIRAVNGTVEVIAAHELVHRFIGKTGISPNGFLWFHEGMAQYISVTTIMNLGYEDGTQEQTDLDNGATQLIQQLDGENFGLISLQDWTPSYQPSGVDISYLYIASYYVVSRLPQIVHQEGLDYYGSFFKLVHGAKVDNINVLALYLSTAANASVALTFQRWGFTVVDLYDSPVSKLVQEAGQAIGGVSPIFQPYWSLAEYLYQQALLSAEGGDYGRAQTLLELSITIAKLAPFLTLLTVAAILALIGYILYRRSKRPKPTVPPLPPEILQPTA